MNGEVDYLPDRGGGILKNGRTKLKPATKVWPTEEVLPNTNISKTRSRVQLALCISIISLFFTIGFFIAGAVWLWTIEDRENYQAEILDGMKKDISEHEKNLVDIQKALGGQRSSPDTICNLPKDERPCEIKKLQLYFDASKGSCLPFDLGFCNGNENNFFHMETCEKRCKTTEICKLKSDAGPCRALHLKWYFDYSRSRCTTFNWGGCNGNGNRFESEKECNDFCKSNSGETQGSSDPKEICALPVKAGPCRALKTRYFYNSSRRKCQQFNYGGCDGNENNFETEEDCQSFCLPRAIY